MIEALRRQFDLAWALTDLHLSALTGDDFLWAPADLVWTLHPDATGGWVADWAESEPDPIPVPTIGWLTWHIIFWWSATLNAVAGQPPRAAAAVRWPGPAHAVSEIRALQRRWNSLLNALTDDDLDRPSSFPWGAGAESSLLDTVLWLNVELTKNGAEIGQLRMLRAAQQ